MAGFGRTGKWFAVDNWDVVPDIITLAKGINSGYVPLGAMVVREPHSPTGSGRASSPAASPTRGHPLACASAVASIEAFQEEGIVENAAAMGEVFRDRARAARREAPVDRRGARARLLLGPRAREEPRDARAARAVQRLGRGGQARGGAREGVRSTAGLYLMTHWNVVMVCPPLTITREELDEGIAILDEALSVADEFVA